ncbi:MAG: hypothetical protein L6Q75_01935 [Burkholderiaceae bacterium]|nr:hypothetical protein [Burkholderiaceae bacterium]
MAEVSKLTLETSEVARLAGVTPDAVALAVRRNGSFRGISPRRAANGRDLIWPADEVRFWLGSRLPSLPSGAWELAGRMVGKVDAPVDALLQAGATLLDSRGFAKSGQRVPELLADVRDVAALVRAGVSRIEWALSDEGQMKPADWQALRGLAEVLREAGDDVARLADWAPVGNGGAA